MAEQASHVLRDAKGIQQALKEALKKQDPWDKEIEFQRKNLRKKYLRLLLVHPTAKESKDAENHLWMQTSYAFISIYKQRITTLDRALQTAPRHQPRQGGHGPVEYRKLMQRFRQFLAEEEKFWIQLVARLRRSFNLDEAQQTLVALGIVANDEPAVAPAPETSEHNAHATSGRNHFQFPPEESAMSFPISSLERAGQLTTLSKAIVCLGDIARYRELYNESGGRPKAGHEDGTGPAKKSGRNKRGGAAGMGDIPRARNYDRAQQCYEQARLLVPSEGNPSHQLAILSSYQKDSFGSLVHYYRALCVLQPYDTASENLGTVLNKALDQWRARLKREKEKTGSKVTDVDNPALPPRLRVENFKERVVVLHALWRLGVDKMESISARHGDGVLKDFSALMSERALPIDIISKVVILAEGALWKHRTIRDSTTTTTTSPITIESSIAGHVLGLHRVLLQVGLTQLNESPPQDAEENDLAQRITAKFRRMLPALRIAGKWLRANFKYVQQAQKEEKKSSSVLVIAGLPLFWQAYAQFTTELYRSFPADRLPSLISSLEEDIDMRGFLPLRKLMGGGDADSISEAGSGTKIAAQVHPNEEQLMRIKDLLEDAKALAGFENSPLLLQSNRYVARAAGSLVQAPSVSYIGEEHHITDSTPSGVRHIDLPLVRPPVPDNDEDAMTEATSRTDDDPVRDAFREVLGGGGSNQAVEEDDQDDEIVWNPRASLSPAGPVTPAVLSSPPRAIPMSPKAPVFTPRSPPVVSPVRKAISPLVAPAAITTSIAPTATTAQDLLDIVTGGHVRNGSLGDTASLLPQKSTAPQPQLLFGSGPPNRPGHSIWSMSLDDSSLKFSNPAPGAHVSRQYEQPPPKFSNGPSQSPWSSSLGDSSQGSQSQLPGALPSAFGLHSHHLVNDGHNRTPSARYYGSQSPRNDAFGFPPSHSPQSYRHQVPGPQFSSSYVDPAIMASSSATSSLYPQASLPAYHHASLGHQNPNVGQAFAQVPQMWGNNG